LEKREVKKIEKKRGRNALGMENERKESIFQIVFVEKSERKDVVGTHYWLIDGRKILGSCFCQISKFFAKQVKAGFLKKKA